MMQTPPQNARGREAHSSEGLPLFIFLVVLGSTLALGSSILAECGLQRGVRNLANVSFTTAVLSIASFAYMRLRGQSWTHWGLRRVKWSVMLGGLGLGLASMPLIALVALSIRMLFSPEAAHPQAELLRMDGLPLPGQALMTLLVVMLAPLAEELLFRGVIFAAITHPHRPMHAVWVSAALFGLLHGALSVMVATFLLGLIMGLLRLRTGSIWPAWALHVGNNGLAWCSLLTGWAL